MSAPLVGWMAEHWFGFPGLAADEGCDDNIDQQAHRGSAHGDSGAGGHHRDLLLATTAAITSAGDPIASNVDKAISLGNALLVFMVVPWTLCALIYTGLYWTYPRDRAATQTTIVVSRTVGHPHQQQQPGSSRRRRSGQ